MQAEKTEVIRTGITGSTLKIIAMITMLIDHIGATIVLQLVQRNSDNFDAFGNVRMTGMVILYYVLRGIGRLAFPIFIFLLLEGFQYTHNRFLYIGRLLLFAIISEIPFDLAVNLSTNSILKGHVLEFTSQNVFFTLGNRHDCADGIGGTASPANRYDFENDSDRWCDCAWGSTCICVAY